MPSWADLNERQQHTICRPFMKLTRSKRPMNAVPGNVVAHLGQLPYGAGWSMACSMA